jgi:hypothetical protein
MCRKIGRDDKAELQTEVDGRIDGVLERLTNSTVFAWAKLCVIKHIKETEGIMIWKIGLQGNEHRVGSRYHNLVEKCSCRSRST